MAAYELKSSERHWILNKSTELVQHLKFGKFHVKTMFLASFERSEGYRTLALHLCGIAKASLASFPRGLSPIPLLKLGSVAFPLTLLLTLRGAVFLCISCLVLYGSVNS